MPLQKRINPMTGQVEYREVPMQQGPGFDPRIPLEVQGKGLQNQKTVQDIQFDRQRANNEQVRLNLELRDKGLEVGPGGKIGPVQRLDVNELSRIRDEAHANLGILDDLGKGSKKWFGTGFLAPTMAKFGGTTAAGQEVNASRLKSTAALNKIMEMAKVNGGKNPLTPMSNSDVDLIANTTANLDVRQPDEDYQKNVQRYRDFYWKTFTAADDQIIAAGGKTKNPFRLKQQQAARPATSTANAPRKIDSEVEGYVKKYGGKR